MTKLSEVLCVDDNNEIRSRWDIRGIFDEVFGGHTLQTNALEPFIKKMNEEQEECLHGDIPECGHCIDCGKNLRE